MNLGVFIYRYNPEPWKWMSPKDSVKVQKEGKGIGGKMCSLYGSIYPKLGAQYLLNTYSWNEERTGKNHLEPPAGGWHDLLALSRRRD